MGRQVGCSGEVGWVGRVGSRGDRLAGGGSLGRWEADWVEHPCGQLRGCRVSGPEVSGSSRAHS